ncbi:MAG: hypothetical protein M3Q69_08950 [Acidobacteriota bacterium]|nr:hypothetical protein [Acidobacteriota bacterium]
MTARITTRFLLLCVLLLAASAAPAAEPLHGNTRTHVFHHATCRYYSCTNCTARFDSVQEARDAGYRACGLCDTSTERSASVDAAFVGNTNTHKFHRNTCRYAGCANCTAKFKTRDEAIAAGFRPGGCCDP